MSSRKDIVLNYEAALDSTYEGIIIIDRDSRVLYANKAYSDILCIPRDKLLNECLRDLQPWAKILTVLETGRPIVNTNLLIPPTNVYVVVNIMPIVKDNQVIGAISVFRETGEATQLINQLKDLEHYTEYLREEIKTTLANNAIKDKIIGDHPSIRSCIDKVSCIAKTDSTVLLTGESGTGKEIFASAIHQLSGRKDKIFLKVNSAAIPESLLESELFGYEEGAFTGSKKGGQLGKFELAHGGTIFLDEIGDISPGMQVKLLRVLEDKTIERIGGGRPIQVDIRVVAATNRDLIKLMDQGLFREDLYYRLNVFPISLPSLRERDQDIMTLAHHFLNEYTHKYAKQLSLSAVVKKILGQYKWPGNIRELKSVIEYLVIIGPESGRVCIDHLPPSLLKSYIEVQDKLIPDLHYLPLQERIKELEKGAIAQALQLSENNKSRAIKLLGISRKAFYKKLKDYNLA